MQISIDIETYSSVDLTKCGVYKYSESPDFEILLFGYSVDGGEVQLVDLTCGEQLPQDILDALIDDRVIKWAFNAQFERVCISRHLGVWLSPTSWRCTKVWAATLGLPMSLESVGEVLGLEKQKLKEGKDLIRLFSIPRTMPDGSQCRCYPQDAPEKWERYKSYNIRDVETEMGIQEKLIKFPVSEQIWSEYILDQIINDRGIALDMRFVSSAIALDERVKARLAAEFQSLTDIQKPNSVIQMREWLSKQGVETEKLGKKEVAALLKTVTGDVEDALLLRQQIAKSSVKKYTAMTNAVCEDSRAHGMFQFYGANRTGRFSGKLIQLQNLPQNHIADLKEARELVRERLYDSVETLYDNIPDILSQLIRTAFVPKNGCRFIVADFSAIEARVLSWMAGEQWRLDVFENGGDIYCATAERMFHVPVVKHGENGHLRQKGKQCELSCGYGGSVGALTAMGALESGMREEELKPLVNAWRSANPNIVKLWWDVDKAVKSCIKHKKPFATHGIVFTYQSGMMFITLPSGRNLVYVRPRIGTNRFDGESITYEGVGESKKWSRVESYGPKFVENITQAISRDILTEAMQRIENNGHRIVAHIHDEVIVEAPNGVSSVEEIAAIMSENPKWAPGLPLRAEGYECDFYKKD